MEKSEPTFVPEWLKSSGSLNTTSHQFQSSSMHSDEQGVSKATRNKSLGNISYNDLGRPSSSYFRHTSSSINGSSLLRSHSSVNKSSHNNGGRLRGGVSRVKIAFERDFPSLGADEKQADLEIGRVKSPGLSSAIQSLPIGNSAVIGGDYGWTSALAEVPVIVGSNGSNVSVVQPVQGTSVSAASSMNTCRNMAETLAQGPPRAQIAPQLSVETQRLEELAVKQSRQLIPMTPSMPKALALNSSDKPKPKITQSQLQSSPRPLSTTVDFSKPSTVGKLHVLKPSRERNGLSSPTGNTKLPNSPLPVPSVITSAPLRNASNNTLEKRPSSSQVRSRNDFFNLMRKKSLTPVTPDSIPSVSASETPTGDGSCGVQLAGEKKGDVACNGDADVASERFTSTNNNNGKDNSSADVILYSEEEEARFLRSLGWEETGDEEGLTEEEISSFYRDVSKYLNLQAAPEIFKGTQPKLVIPLHSQMGKNSSDSKLES